MPFHVFLSHSSADKPAVEEIARQLAKEGIQPWLDRWHLIPGDPWQPAIEKALAESESCAVFIGPSGFGPWQNEEMRAAIDRRVHNSGRRFRVIPVLLPGAERLEHSSLPLFLAAATWAEFHDSLDDENAFHQLVCGIRGIAPGAGPGQALFEGQCPYRGLRVFDVDDAPFFFGREALVERLLSKLLPATEGKAICRFLAIVGASGSGKSSLTRAGLVAALKHDKLAGSSHWPIAICRPGPDPIESLAVAISKSTNLGQSPSTLAELIAEFQKNEKTLHLVARQSLPENAADMRLVVVVDQFEEVFTLCCKEESREMLVRNLLFAAKVAQGQTLVVLTMRADFYPKCAANAELAAAFSDHHMLVGPMTDNELRRAVERPIQLVGCELEAGLVDLLVQDVRRQPGALPLLQHALLELWNKREGRRLTVRAYQEIGKLEGALQRRAEAILNAFSQDEQELCRRTFLRLTNPGEGTEDTKRRASMKELLSMSGESNAEEHIIQRLVDASLLTTEGDFTRKDAFVEVAHEALIHNWSRLRQWLDEDRIGRRLHHRISEVAQEWQRSNKEEGLLYRGARLTQAREWREQNEAELNLLECEFLDASIAGLEKSDQQRRQRQWFLFGAVVLLLFLSIAASGFGIFGFWQKQEAEAKNRELGSLLEEAAQSDRLVAEEKLQGGKDSDALAYLARAVRYLPESSLAVDASMHFMLSAAVAPLRVTFRNPTGAIDHAFISPDGSRVLTVSADRIGRLWETESGKLLVTLQNPSVGVYRAVFSPDSRRVLTDSGNTTGFWEVESGKLLATFDGHIPGNSSAVLSPDGRRVLTARDNTAELWEVDSGKLLARFRSPTGVVLLAAFSPNGQRVLTVSNGNAACFWEAESGKLLATSQGPIEPVRSAVFSPDGRRVLTLSNADAALASLWEVESGKLSATFRGPTASISSAVFSPDGRRVLAGADNNTALLWEADGGKLLNTFQGNIAVFSPDGRRIFTAGSNDKIARLWETESGKLLTTYQGLTGIVYGAVFSSDARHVLAVSGDTALLWEVEGGKLLSTFQGHTGGVRRAVFSPDGRRVLAGADDNTARLWETDGGKLLNTFQGNIAVFSPEGRRIFTAGSNDKIARLWETESGKLLTTCQGLTGIVYGAVFSSDSRRLLTCSYDHTTRLWEAESGKVLTTLDYTRFVYSLALSPDGRRVLTGSDDNTARLWEAESGKLLVKFEGHEGTVLLTVFSPDGQRVLTGSKDNTARLWETESGKLLAVFKGHINPVVLAVFSPDSRRVLTAASNDPTARLWEVGSGKLLATLPGRRGMVNVVFSADGRQVITISDDNVARFWEAESGKLLATFRGPTASISSAVLSPDGRHLLITSGGSPCLWPLLPTNVRPPDWCGDFLDWLGGERIAPDGQIETFSGDELLKLETRLRAHMNEDTDYARLLRWRLLPLQERPVEPYGKTTREQAADLIIRPDMNEYEAEHAYDLDPWHPLVHLALANFEKDPLRADFLRQYSLDRLPKDPKLRQRAAEFLRKQAKEDLAREVEGRTDK